MTKRKVWRYKCDHCKKSGCSGGAMKVHECRCFRNPMRACPMCKAQWPIDGVAEVMVELEQMDESNEEVLTQKVRDAVEGCPACMCAVFMQAKLPQVEWENQGWDGSSVSIGSSRYHVKFNYAKERDSYMEDMRREEAGYYS